MTGTEIGPYRILEKLGEGGPVLLLNGRYDFDLSPEAQQKPLFEFLGTPDRDKRYTLFDAGHVPPVQATMRETPAWFDRYLGPVDLR